MAYFNTTNETGKLLLKYKQKTETQEDYILRYITFETKESINFETSSHLLSNLKAFSNTPITSIRRAVSNLVKKGSIIYTGDKRKGIYDHKEKIIKLN